MSHPVRRIRTTDHFGGIELDVVDAGKPGDPVIVLAHGFPESAHSWRHQIDPLVAAGYRVLVPNQRGYASSSAPRDVAAYRSDHLAADLIALLDDTGADDAVFVGHDWGSMVVWDTARFHPERVRGVINVSVPYTPWPAPPTELMKMMWTDRFFYILYFQPVGPAEAELDGDVRRTMNSILWAASGDMFGPMPTEFPPMEGTGFVDSMERNREIPADPPPWMTTADLDTYVEQFTTSGFFGPVSWYRNLDADHELTKDLPAPAMPTAFIGGTKDPVIAYGSTMLDAMSDLLPDFRGTVMIDDAGHWTQQERPAEFNAGLLDLLSRLS